MRSVYKHQLIVVRVFARRVTPKLHEPRLGVSRSEPPLVTTALLLLVTYTILRQRRIRIYDVSVKL